MIGQWNNPEIRAIVTAHLQAAIGLPVAGVFAFLVVALFRTTEGRIRFEVLGLKFDGAANQYHVGLLLSGDNRLEFRLLWG